MKVNLLSLLFAALASAANTTTSTSNSQPPIILPTQHGPHPITIYSHEIRTTRPDPLAPTPNQLRRLMITIYRPFLSTFTCPLESQSLIPYMSPVIASALLSNLPGNISTPETLAGITSIQQVNCTLPIDAGSPSGPLLLFQPGYGGSHHGYASTIYASASSGYTVVAIDPTWEAAAVEFPDGDVAYHSNMTDVYQAIPFQAFLAAVRINDTVSVLDAIENGEVPGLENYAVNASSSSGYSTNATGEKNSTSNSPLRALMYGTSFGGSCAVNVALQDPRVIAAGNIDGPYDEPAKNSTITKPLFMMSSSANEVAFTWPDYYRDHVRGWKTWVNVNNTVHYDFSDLPLIADLLGMRETAFTESLIGTVDSRRLQEIWRRYTVDFFDWATGKGKGELLDGASEEFPDVEFVGHEEAVKK